MSYPFDIDESLDLLNDSIQNHQSIIVYDKEADTANSKRELGDDDEPVTATSKKAVRKSMPDKSQTKDVPVDPKQKRKAQNRAAQRAFRDRKEKHVAELQARISELEEINAKKDESLVKENLELKELIKKLREENDSLKKPQDENYALKDTRFTFQFPVQPAQEETYQTPSNSSSSSTEEAEQYSPSSNNNPISLDFLDNQFLNQPLGSDLLIHGKDDLFSNYPMPNNDFLFPNEDLTALFGGNDANLFGWDMAQQFGLSDVVTDKKQRWLNKLKLAKEEGKYMYDFHQEVIKEMPDFNIDALCDDMRRKAQCSLSRHVITDEDVAGLTHRVSHPFTNIF